MQIKLDFWVIFEQKEALWYYNLVLKYSMRDTIRDVISSVPKAAIYGKGITSKCDKILTKNLKREKTGSEEILHEFLSKR